MNELVSTVYTVLLLLFIVFIPAKLSSDLRLRIKRREKEQLDKIEKKTESIEKQVQKLIDMANNST